MAVERELDLSADLSAWQAVTVGRAQLALSSASSGRAPALRMAFDFNGAGGFVVARRELKRVMPGEYAVRFRMRGRGAVNDLETKLIDATGQNVWRNVMRGLRPAARWKSVKIESRDIEFAWGPAGGGTITELGAIELAIVAQDGGAGTMDVSDLTIEDCSPRAPATANASSALPGFEAGEALGGTGWTPRRDDAKPWIVVDFNQSRTIGGLIIDWRGSAPASGFRVRGSLRGRRWSTLHATRRAGGARSYVYLPDTRARFLRLELNEASAGAILRPQPFEFSRSIDIFWQNVASREAPGWYPRWLHREQSLWTVVGVPNGTHCAVMSEEGMVELEPGSFSIEPMLWIDDRLFTWTDVSLRQELQNDFFPVPSAIWETAHWRLRVEPEAKPNGGIRVRYRLENRREETVTVRLIVLVRPFQVTPPWQRVGEIGGVTSIRNLEWRAGTLMVNDTLLVVSASEPSGFAAATFDEGFIVPRLMADQARPDVRTHDASGFASAAIAFELLLLPG